MALQTLVHILFLSLVYLLLAKSFELIYKTSGVFNIVHAFTVSLAAYIAYSVGKLYCDSLCFTIPVAIVVTAIIMTAIEGFIILPLTRSRVAGWKAMVVTLALYYVLQNCLKIIWGDNNLPFHNFQGDITVTIWDNRISMVQIVAIGISLLAFIAVALIGEKTEIGKRIRACSIDSELSSTVGLNKDRLVLTSFLIGSVLASIAGICVAADTHISPNLGFNWFFLGVVALVIGGMGKTRYMVFAAVFLAVVQQLTAYFLDAKWMNATAYVILVIFLYFRPFGFSGKRLKKAEV